MSNLSVFAFEGHGVRFVGTPNEPEWVAQDVCQALDIQNYRDALSGFDDEEKGVAIADTPGGKQEVLTVKEPGLYRLIFKSRKAVAKRFQRWVFHEVLPSIRKAGSYNSNTEPTTNINTQPVEPPQEPLPDVHPDLAPIRDIILLSDKLGGLSESEQTALKAIMLEKVLETMNTRSQVAQVSVEQPVQTPGQTVYRPVPRIAIDNPRLIIADRARVLGYRPTSGQLISIGQIAARYYRQRYGINPAKEEMLIGGQPCQVNVYNHSDIAIIDSAIQSVMER